MANQATTNSCTSISWETPPPKELEITREELFSDLAKRATTNSRTRLWERRPLKCFDANREDMFDMVKDGKLTYSTYIRRMYGKAAKRHHRPKPQTSQRVVQDEASGTASTSSNFEVTQGYDTPRASPRESRDDKIGRLATLIATKSSSFNDLKLDQLLKLAGEADVCIDMEESNDSGSSLS